MLEVTNIMPIKGIKRLFNEKILIAPINPPSEREPVSPIKTFALLTLKHKKPTTPPTKHDANNKSLFISCILISKIENFSHCKQIKAIKKTKYVQLTCPAKPSSPSVKLTLFVIAKNIIITKGITNAPISSS